MSEQVNTSEQNNKEQQGCCGSRRQGCGNGHERHCHRGHCFMRVIGLLVVFGIGFLSGKAFACEPGWSHNGPGAFMEGKAVDAEHMAEFADKRMQHMLDDVSASDAQKAKASEIVKASLSKGLPLAEKMRDNHIQLRKLMSAATLDKPAIEALRAEQVKLVDEASKLATQTMQDVAEVLTPEQRAKLAEKMEKHHGWMHHG
ncbi:MAG TPA: Spy/CpxP family protein refolding chaperone [Gallionella sp.]|nr:Spy/CpxP family protein refolding chaperone [Gallionella sp.]